MKSSNFKSHTLFFALLLVFSISTLSTECQETKTSTAPQALKLMSLNQQMSALRCEDACDAYEKECRNQGNLSDAQQRKCNSLKEKCEECSVLGKDRSIYINFCKQFPELCSMMPTDPDDPPIGGPECQTCPDEIFALLSRVTLTDNQLIDIINPRTQQVVGTIKKGSSVSKELFQNPAFKNGAKIILNDRKDNMKYPITFTRKR